MAFSVYVAFEHELRENLDDTLRLRAASNLQLVDLRATPTLTITADPGQERSEGEAVVRLYDASGQLLFDASPAAGTSLAEVTIVKDAASGGTDVYRTITFDHETYRIIASPVRVDDVVAGVLITGVEEAQVADPLAILRLMLAIVVPLTSIAMGLGGFWISRRALKPVATITATAQRISLGDLRSRIEGISSRDEVGELADTFNAMIGRLAETVDRERRFTADASHELRTPLAAIETSIDVTLSHERENAEYRHTLEAVRGQAHRLASLTRQLLLLSRLDSEHARDEFELIDITGLVDAVVASFLDTNPDAHVSVESAVPTIEVCGDVQLLARAFQNILENATLHVGPAVRITIVITRLANPARAAVSISDDGPGISGELAKEVFQRFRRGNASRSDGGSGLGLAIVEGIILFHGGTLRLVPSEGDSRGAQFEMKLPLAT